MNDESSIRVTDEVIDEPTCSVPFRDEPYSSEDVGDVGG